MRWNHWSKLLLLHAIITFLRFVLCAVFNFWTQQTGFLNLFFIRIVNVTTLNFQFLNTSSCFHMERTFRYFLARSWTVILGRRWEFAFLVEETVGVFTTNLSMSTVLSVFNEKNYILPNDWQLRLFCNHFSNVNLSASQIGYLNKGFVCVTPTGNSLRMRLVPGPK